MFYCSAVDFQWPAAGNAGSGPDERVRDVVFQWLRVWWRPQAIQVWQMSRDWKASIRSIVLRLLRLAPDS